jgi:glycosyltransferase involved in cell wall biosynthesis
VISRAAALARPIVWISSPTQHDARLDLDARLRVYHVVDDYLAYYALPEAHRSSFARRERELIEWADLVIAVSPELIDTKGRGNPKFHLLPNGFDAEAYRPDCPIDLPAALAGMPRPILGYVGLISVRLDLAMLDAVAARRPEWTLVLMGSIFEQGCEDALGRLQARPNVRFLPPVPGHQVAGYVRSFDLGLVPYRVTQETFHASPLKVYEYLAAGLPVVAADVPGARQFADMVAIASSFDAWEDAIARELAGDCPGARAERRMRVAPHSWNGRVETLSDYLLEALA